MDKKIATFISERFARSILFKTIMRLEEDGKFLNWSYSEDNGI